MNSLEGNENQSQIKALEWELIILAKKYKNLVVLNADFGTKFGMNKFSEIYDKQYFNLGLQEANMAGVAAGLFLRGKVPFILGLANFCVGRAWEQIRDLICYPNLNVKIVSCGSGFKGGDDGVGYKALEDIAIMRALPNMKIICPADHCETLSAISVAFASYGPVYLRLSEGEFPAIFENECKFEFGKSRILREGKDVCIFTMGAMASVVMKATEILKRNGVEAGIVNISSIKPIDAETIVKAAKPVGFAVTVEDHNIIGGLGSAVAEVLGENCPVKLKRIGIEDKFGESGKWTDLYKKHGLNLEGVAEKIMDFIKNP